ncbi:hypothetical protein B484DRAFT_456809 [Ochromonadaceae sp. CCMP2298]|nr:hypothetical protein B484DRAFT_456809 [Ochromonadaceae sp. CCMP2298]
MAKFFLTAMLLVSVAAFRRPALSSLSLTRLAALPTPESIAAAPFMESFDLAASVCDGLLSPPSDAAAALLVPRFFCTSDAARGWFVTSLTTPEYRAAALHPSVVDAVVNQPLEQSVTRLMLMNVIMPRATAMQHAAAGNSEMAAASMETFDRAQTLVRLVAARGESRARTELREDAGAIGGAAGWDEKEEKGGEKEEGDVDRVRFWVGFMKQWGYGPTQRQAIKQVVEGLYVHLR